MIWIKVNFQQLLLVTVMQPLISTLLEEIILMQPLVLTLLITVVRLSLSLTVFNKYCCSPNCLPPSLGPLIYKSMLTNLFASFFTKTIFHHLMATKSPATLFASNILAFYLTMNCCQTNCLAPWSLEIRNIVIYFTIVTIAKCKIPVKAFYLLLKLTQYCD